jgi:hypothetical protein
MTFSEFLKTPKGKQLLGGNTSPQTNTLSLEYRNVSKGKEDIISLLHRKKRAIGMPSLILKICFNGQRCLYGCF